MAPTTGTEERYSTAMEELWRAVARHLTWLDRLAADPYELGEDETHERLQRLQYSLHVASEHAYGLDPPLGAETAHSELAAALAGARDATAEVAEALDAFGQEAFGPLLHEWRGALFRVRLARLRLAPPVEEHAADEEPRAAELMRPAGAVLLALAGALGFVAGAALGLWPVWLAGLVAVCAAVLVYRP